MTLPPENCNAPFAGFSNCGLPKGHAGDHAHGIFRLAENAENPPLPEEERDEEEENKRLLTLDRIIYGVCFTDIHGKRIDPDEVTPYT